MKASDSSKSINTLKDSGKVSPTKLPDKKPINKRFA